MHDKFKVFPIFITLLTSVYGADHSESSDDLGSSWVPTLSLLSFNFGVEALSNGFHDWREKSFVDEGAPQKSVTWTVTTYDGSKGVRTESVELLELSLHGTIGLPKDISLFTNLTRLDLSENSLVRSPAWWDLLSPSYYLDFEYPEITYDYFSEDIMTLTSLKKLILNGNYLTVLPDSISQLVNLEGLFSGCNRLTALPSTFPALSRLTELYLEYNYLSDLPPSFGQLPCLMELNLRSNKFKFFPREILNLVSLKSLYIDDNKVRDIPQEIGNMKQLKTLTVRNNGLRNFPYEVLKLEKLDFLGFKENPLLGVLEKDFSKQAYSSEDNSYHDEIAKLKAWFKGQSKNL